MNYEEALTYLAALNKFGIQLGLTRIRILLELMGNPQQRFKTVHVTGTNGKGSTAAMLASILKVSGIRTGLYTSPHLTSYTERFTINGLEITKSDFAAVIEITRHFVAKMLAEGNEQPTEFEVLTAAAFYWFAESEVEYAVIEVGLGGLLDSTNVIVPEVAVVTNVALDHTNRCGQSVAEIAVHKAGIIKPGVPVVTAADGDALRVIAATARSESAELLIFGKDFGGKAVANHDLVQEVEIEIKPRIASQYTLSLLGIHQVKNAAVAVMAAEVLARDEKRIKQGAIARGLAAVVWPGRLEFFNGQPVCIVDGAHNPAGAITLRKNLDSLFPDKSITFLLGILSDKDVEGILQALIRPCDKVVVAAPLSERAADPETVAGKITAAAVETTIAIEQGLERAAAIAGPDGVVCAAGSLYLIGNVRQVLLCRHFGYN
ncbi:hypothetical protein P22_0037 [Propionispora sp. 2/2-37]|uniref:bifunctional folylpolyglutamate synthase/dihydrofolate synthase n=1 Tax=Propionispora sp. 2/2-37 TaxID=1677858 RepID=UPI0006BB792D|nr:folylpolyglutamate synthase/dihydrofolate synthase family protein [Propionispora sp. 2/2-37]CUH93975.1 hypothetical protein P22_0037 [Propionispora sp. 2/2-37]